MKLEKEQGGYTIVELLISLVMLAIVVVSFTSLYVTLVGSSKYAKLKSVALTLATNQMEYLKSLSYDQLAVIGGNIVSTSYLTQTTTKTIDGTVYIVRNDIDYADDSFDGCAAYPSIDLMQKYCRNYPAPSGSPVDSNPKDYKIVDVTVSLQATNKELAQVSTNVSARVAETSSNTGALVVRVNTISGDPVADATVVVTNSTVTPAVNQSQTTDVNGVAIYYDLPPDTTNFDYKITASKTDYSSLTTIVATATLQPTYPNQQIITQQASLVTMHLNPKGKYSLAVETTNTSGVPIGGVIASYKGGYKKYTDSANTEYYQNSTITTDASGLGAIQNLDPGPFFFCGDNGAVGCTVGATTYYLAAAVPYTDVNAFQSINVPTYTASYPPTTIFAYGGNNYLQKVQLMLTTSATFPRVSTLTPASAVQSGSDIAAFPFEISGTNLPCSTTPSSCSTIVRFKQGASVYTASCVGATGTRLNCTVDLSTASLGVATLELVANGQTLSIPSGSLGGINVISQ